MMTNMECWALRAQIQELLAVLAMKKRPSPQLINALRASEAALQVALHKEWRLLQGEAATAATALSE